MRGKRKVWPGSRRIDSTSSGFHFHHRHTTPNIIKFPHQSLLPFSKSSNGIVVVLRWINIFSTYSTQLDSFRFDMTFSSSSFILCESEWIFYLCLIHQMIQLSGDLLNPRNNFYFCNFYCLPLYRRHIFHFKDVYDIFSCVSQEFTIVMIWEDDKEFAGWEFYHKFESLSSTNNWNSTVKVTRKVAKYS